MGRLIERLLATVTRLYRRFMKPVIIHPILPKEEPKARASGGAGEIDPRFGWSEGPGRIEITYTSEPEPEPEVPPPPKMNRAQRRATDSEYRKALKARLQYDKFVNPKGPKPVKQIREKIKSKPQPEPEPQELSLAHEPFIVDHYDENPNNPIVLFEESEFFGQFNFRDTILDQLDRYWFYLERMKENEPDAFGFYRQMGMQLVPYSAVHLTGKARNVPPKPTPEELIRFKQEIRLPPAFNAKRPGFGCIAYGSNPKVESWEVEKKKSCWPRFLYFIKYKQPPPTVQMMTGGDIYKMTIWWDNTRHSRKWGIPQDFSIFIDRSGQHIQLLKTCKTEMIPMKKKRGLGRFFIPDHNWHFPQDFVEWANEMGLDPNTHLCHLFCEVLEHLESSQFGDVRVQVHKDDLTAVFNIDSRRLSYFFQDRDVELNEHGQRKRVFHIVRPQVRKNGSVVKMHYRGERDFTWAGYKVNITVPGLDHFHLSDMGIGVSDSYWIKNVKGTISEPELAEMLVKRMNQGLGGYKR